MNLNAICIFNLIHQLAPLKGEKKLDCYSMYHPLVGCTLEKQSYQWIFTNSNSLFKSTSTKILFKLRSIFMPHQVWSSSSDPLQVDGLRELLLVFLVLVVFLSSSALPTLKKIQKFVIFQVLMMLAMKWTHLFQLLRSLFCFYTILLLQLEYSFSSSLIAILLSFSFCKQQTRW